MPEIRPGRIEKEYGLIRYDQGDMVEPDYTAWYVWRGRLIGFRHPQTGYVLRDNVWGEEGESILRQIAGNKARVPYAVFRERYKYAFGEWPGLHHWQPDVSLRPQPLPELSIEQVADCWL